MDLVRVIREQDPLKQGLKLKGEAEPERVKPWIREQDPLKQGLKLFEMEIYAVPREYSRARSIKTRIET